MDTGAQLVADVCAQAQLQRRLAEMSARAIADQDAAAFFQLQRDRDREYQAAGERQERLRERAQARDPLPAAQLEELIDALALFRTWSFTSIDWVPLESLARLVRRSLEDRPPSPALTAAIDQLATRRLAEGGPAEARRAATILANLGPVRHVPEAAGMLDRDDDWGAAAGAELDQRGDETRPWMPLLEHAATATQSKPAERWLTTAQTHLDALGHDGAVELLACLLEALDAPPSGEMRRGAGTGALAGLDHLPRAVPTERNATILRGLVWSASLRGGEDVAAIVAAAARACQRKLPDVGARCPKVVNACLWSLAAMPGEAGAGHLVALQERTKKPAARARVEAALARAAENAGVPQAVLEDRAVPTHGLESGPLVLRSGQATCEVTIEPPGSIVQDWRSAAGRSLARPPSRIPRELRDLRATLGVQRGRFERLLAAGTTWPWARFRDGVLAHPISGAIAGSLIIEPQDGKPFLPVAEAPPVIADDLPVRLWHPAGKPLGEVLAWRDRLERLQVTQPFKQAHREVYLLTPAEREAGDRSPRFAGFVLRQHALAALAGQRGWRYRLQGPFDPGGDPDPALALPEHELTATLETELIDDEALQSGHAIFLYIRTGALRFRRDHRPVPLEDVPSVVLSEVLRDVDLFVSVAGIGADPQWPASAPPGWVETWHDQAFAGLTPLGERRRETLERVLPGLPFAADGELDGRFLIVRGRKGSYRIHLGSGGVLMEPGSRALCIVTAGGGILPGEPGHVWLPFEGDITLAAILSKAMLLWRDDEITDASIRAQMDGV